MPGRRLGQHFLKNARTLNRIAELGELSADDLVIEIGAGRGELTRFLLERAGRVVTFEVDPAVIRNMDPALARNERLVIKKSDAVRASFSALARGWPGPVKLISNIPYYISTPLLRKLIEERERISLAVLLLQREFARRLTARPGTKEYGSLTVLSGLYYEIEICFPVPPSFFSPRPRVSSSAVRFRPLSSPRVDAGNPNTFSRIVQHAFRSRRKTVFNALRSALGADTGEILDRAGITPGRRPDTLTVDEYGRISRILEEKRHVRASCNQP